MEKKKRAMPKHSNVVPMKMDATFFFEKAVQSLDRYHYDKALKYFRRAAEYEPENPVNHCNLAGLLSEMGNYEESNRILQHVLERIDPSMTECYFYMANNFANMENYESAEEAIIHYLENDPNGQFLEESEEMMELLSYELDRPTKLTTIKSQEGLFEHDRARSMLEEGRFSEAVRVLEKIIRKHPDFMAARNNLALAYYYMGHFEKSVDMIGQVLELEPGNLHALCNLAIFYQHFGDIENLSGLLEMLRKTYPFHQEHAFKLATTMGILSEHEKAYLLFKRLLKNGEVGLDPSLCHYTAVAAYNTGRYEEAERWWRQAEKFDPGSEIPKFYLNLLKKNWDESVKPSVSYHYHLPFEEQFRGVERSENGMPEHLKRDPLVRSSFFWALRHGDTHTKLQVIQAFGLIADDEVKDALLEFIGQPNEDDYLKKVAIFVLRSIGVKEPLTAVLEGSQTTVAPSPFAPGLPIWEPKWQQVMETAMRHMFRRYDMVQQYDLQTLWVEYLSRVFPSVPKITKVEGWAAALEYLIAKMHRRPVSYQETAERYGVSVATVSKNAKMIDEACGLKEKMDAIFNKFASLES
ncbi:MULTISPECIES: tetratricopeptide repeat protein [unclassified Paenibacillus]|uniref:tetratricopeptide repeat protein n=1 Tax=unclassified Paenibacillus TaxID=185978 RepID=UPI001AE934BB|nr:MULTISPECIES: tetratricopeptide repeat protein [unclassified Paenibacillus]MBP1157711.1 tetratricopeptide (TPR) repeat protein [Paenibacillus sp. PvP091]MBP1171553.1 tetratricopeptide (TPR) repeat protein [Paenibacillus sp. PvR098]MBP2437934.1 tetratricopeptide (TPR) repeat protein [Paenibacillus sp. PvP052]